jgi:hypothetical protein
MSEIRVHCPNCTQLVEMQSSSTPTRMMACPHCGTQFEVRDSGMQRIGLQQISQSLHQWIGLDDRNTLAQPLPRKQSQPERIAMQTTGHDLSLTLPWSWKRSWFVVLPALAWGLYTAAQALGQLMQANLGNALLLAVIAFPAFYLVAAFWRNATHVRITRSRLEVRSRPLPWWDYKGFDVADIHHLGAEADAFDGQETAPEQRKWRIYARLTDETRITLLEDIQQEEADFLVQELESALRVEDTPAETNLLSPWVPNPQQVL